MVQRIQMWPQSLECDFCFGRPSGAVHQWSVATVQKMVLEKWRVKVPDVAEVLHVSVISIE